MSASNNWFSEFENFATNQPETKKTSVEEKELIIETKNSETPKSNKKRKLGFYYFLFTFFLLILFLSINHKKTSQIREKVSNELKHFERKMDTLRLKLHGVRFEKIKTDSTNKN